MAITISDLKPTWKGTYAGGTAYVVNDVVSYNGNSYICILASTGNLPTDTTYWKPSAKGSDLGDGATALDMAYYDGSNWVRQAIGTANQAFKVNSSANGLEFGAVSGGNLVQVKHFRKNSTIDNANTSDSVLSSPFNGDYGITPTAAANFIAVDFFVTADHGDTWRSGYDRLQYSTDSGSSWTDLAGAGDSSYRDSGNMHGNMKYVYAVIPNQNTTNEHKIRIVHNAHSQGYSRRMGQFSNEGQDNGNNSNPNTSHYSSGFCMTMYEYKSTAASVTNVS